MKFKKLHSWNLNPQEAIKIQNKLRRKIKLTDFKIKPQLIAAADVAFKDNLACAAVILMKLPDFRIIEWVRKTQKIKFPYIPGLLTFREGPVLENCFRAAKFEPDVILFDGQGIAHPRNMGIAAHMGILLDKSTIGCAKTWLFGEYKEPGNSRGAFSYLFNQKKKIGAVLRTRVNVKPVFVSPGYKIDIESAVRLILMCARKYRIPEPLRLAHQLSQRQPIPPRRWEWSKKLYRYEVNNSF